MISHMCQLAATTSDHTTHMDAKVDKADDLTCARATMQGQRRHHWHERGHEPQRGPL